MTISDHSVTGGEVLNYTSGHSSLMAKYRPIHRLSALGLPTPWSRRFFVSLEYFVFLPRVLYTASKGRCAKMCMERVGRIWSVNSEESASGGEKESYLMVKCFRFQRRVSSVKGM
ncbi:hypothetical protein E2C01_032509 [Portunus trituberculatus]|uniref:Uncharacterized protein n=1 Tax=Portunus trituberculatus TaxID=210409 RepID=A0A5B7EVG0_PORTR|nr:hypothetical protein [Portunus trituberculatus]